ncbi:hypothetical protein M0L20_11965 [Spirosoma sp. RP8]|uniref:Uncharacterized protein n=1 Tax=Spirosoma liriopis TaxID=2937440 RepID=A0ABT0HK74_9BACT|nr:hypothetical protein [Spirosoma liriopis]MCK8492572.1 hypothetical protein [Spirosoma liriopis]
MRLFLLVLLSFVSADLIGQHPVGQRSAGRQAVARRPVPKRYVNVSHLNHLYQPFTLANGTEVGTVFIYSEAPTYTLVADSDEGFTCVDDVARAGLFLLHEPDLPTDTDKQNKLMKLTEMVLQMQATEPDSVAGYFYNFLFKRSLEPINKRFRTSVASPNFWSWRAFWFLTEVYSYFHKTSPTLADCIEQANRRLQAVMLRDFGSKPRTFVTVRGVQVPTWLPFGSGSDQAAIMLLGLLNRYQQKPDSAVVHLIEQLGDGIVAMRQGGPGQFPYGAILSYENNWHAYASDQSYALQRAGKILNKPEWQAVARQEINNFYPYLLKQGFLESFELKQVGNERRLFKRGQFPQIAYGIRPMIWAALEAYEQTKEMKYADLAGRLSSWFLGRNAAKTSLYDPATGRGYDGIISAGKLNRNSGAESTIEALWAFQKLEQYPAAMKALENYK